MEPPKKFSLMDRFASFRYAFAGLQTLLETQHNARVQLVIGLAVLALSWWLEIGKTKMVLILLTIGLVWISEALNTVFELLFTIVSPNYSLKAKLAKDVAAGSVLIASLVSVVVGVLILLPPLVERLSEFTRGH